MKFFPVISLMFDGHDNASLIPERHRHPSTSAVADRRPLLCHLLPVNTPSQRGAQRVFPRNDSVATEQHTGYRLKSATFAGDQGTRL